jgi:hypothetical protein
METEIETNAKFVKNMQESEIILTPLEQRYISTCYPLPDRPFIKEANKWKERLRKTQEMGNILLSLEEIGKAFPHIGMLYKIGFFEKRSIQSYFEGLDEKGHNTRMYLFAKKCERSKIPKEMLLGVMLHVEHCSVRIAETKNSKICSYLGEYEYPIDLNYFGNGFSNEYVIVHGKSEKGAIAIRDLSRDEFDVYKKWFEERQKSKSNPFAKHEKFLKNLLYSDR